MRPNLVKFVIFTLFFRCLTENLLTSMVSIGVDFSYLIEKNGRDLEGKKKVSFLFQILSFVWAFGKISLLGLLIKLTISPISYIHDGLVENTFRVGLYYAHFILYRLALALLVFFSPLVPGKYLLLIMSVI